ncbi:MULTISPECIES: inositol monophosphatase family protein [Sphingobium]|uniref:inositol monophosphatase family protein n=1 Tax=Sphingobium TaxID=165695 RepID=UPI0015EB4EA6|nr:MULTISPECIES: inositol monophosphatase family protein [Sphingobium]MCW2361957.1 fructose-1,6-bisphosphatase/inositol monophosphatase family enzyme [Sphingobium sp. B10D3B]MCW2381653.1 fructose-1,6-bisphosphatase/inositol monophosphatase family enzyme [Sphingobium sp. B2D3B]MCW2398240.1 fructose-1,6-bisphosphatase/inositol monophosphatase family enzyme [Sphingobium sp. B2D3C]MCW2401364.1 fructose-1,6-bisphosphatase/inositol monophosphatase family enzyme [Sphingobium sp. B10D7B]MCW2408344.1 f
MNSLSSAVSALLRDVARDVVLQRYQNLANHEVEEKTVGELVTIADREAELRLNEGLSRILPEAGLVGEEACAADPGLTAKLETGLNWVIDPIDGTANFASGKPPFAIMVALADAGVIQAGWILDPLTGRLCEASLGQGAWIDGERVEARESGADIPVAGLSVLFLNPADRQAMIDRVEGQFAIADIPRCAGEQYPRIVLGVHDLAAFERTLPWDHAPGALFVNEAGGRVARPDGSPYRLAADPGRGLLAAASPALWDRAAAVLYG